MKKNCLLLLILMWNFLTPVSGQQNVIKDKQIHTLKVTVDDDPLMPPIVNLGGNHHIEIGFDDFSHEYHRYIYHITHCDAQWQPSKEIFESDFLEGFNDRPIEDYEKSFNTTVLYTHYKVRIPNEDVSLKLSGNYKVVILNDDGDEPVPVAEVCFSIVEPRVSINAQVSSNTDIDFNKTHQQLSFTVNYTTTNVVDPIRELKTVVMQNRRTDNMVFNPKPNIQSSKQIEFSHNRQLIFPAGNEYHKFEILDVHQPGLNVDRIEWHDPHYHAVLFADKAAKNYVYDEDQNGAFIVRNTDDWEINTTSEYLFVHFMLSSPRLTGGDVYINGEWTGNQFSPEYKMTYNETLQAYETAILLKQGYYNYNYLFLPDGKNIGNSDKTDGNFYETENEYIILVYQRPVGGRYDKLVGYRKMNFKN